MGKKVAGKAGQTVLFACFIIILAARPGYLSAAGETTPKLTAEEKGSMLLTVDKAYDNITEVKKFIEGLAEKAKEKNDLVAKDCLNPLYNQARDNIGNANNLKVEAKQGIIANDSARAGNGIKNLVILHEQYKKWFEEALTCLSLEGSKKDWKEEVVRLIAPLVTFDEKELLALPEPSLEPKPWLSIYR